MRFFRYVLIALIGIVIAVAALIWEGGTLEQIFVIGEVPAVDFASLQRAPTPNQYLLCPAGMCVAAADGAAPVFNLPADRLQGDWDLMIAQQPRVLEVRRDLPTRQVDYVQRSRLLRFPDLITVRFIPVDDTHSTVAIYSRSIYGKGDLGVNRARIDQWLAKLKAKAG